MTANRNECCSRAGWPEVAQTWEMPATPFRTAICSCSGESAEKCTTRGDPEATLSTDVFWKASCDFTGELPDGIGVVVCLDSGRAGCEFGFKVCGEQRIAW